MKAGVPQGSPLSPLIFAIYLSALLRRLTREAPLIDVVVYADDITLTARDSDPYLARDRMQEALNIISEWAGAYNMETAPDKTIGTVISSDCNEFNGKCCPALLLDNVPITYKPDLTILGVRIDSQLRFTEHALQSEKQLKARINILKALAGTTWGSDEDTLRQLYVSYARPGALYAAGIWFPFLANSNAQRLESANYSAARVITGAPAGTNAAATLREAEIPPLNLLCKRDAGQFLLHAKRFPARHPVGRLAIPPKVARRLKSARAGLRGNWYDCATAALDELPHNPSPEPWPPPEAVPAPWSSSGEVTFHLAGAEIPRSASAEERKEAADSDLNALLPEGPHVDIWSDGSAMEGIANGGAGCAIRWHDDREVSVLSAPAGALASSTAAEAAAALLGLKEVAQRLDDDLSKPTIRLLFDSRSLYMRLQSPLCKLQLHPTTLEAAKILRQLSLRHRTMVIWVPGHAGLELNEVADGAAKRGSTMDQSGIQVTTSSLKKSLNRQMLASWQQNYTAAMHKNGVPHPHLLASEGGKPSGYGTLARRDAVTLHRLRLNRFPELGDTRYRWKVDGVESAKCTRCGHHKDDTEHFLTDCPALTTARIATMGPSPQLDILQKSPNTVLAFLKLVAPILARA